MTGIRAKHYDEAVEYLTKHPVVRAMADEIAVLPVGTVDLHDGEFMVCASKEFYKRGGTMDGGGIGSVAEALRKLLGVPERRGQE